MTPIKRVPLAEALGTAPVFVDGDWIESKDQNPEGDVRLIQLADIGIGSFINKSRRFLTGNTARRLGCTFMESGDVLIARMPDPIGRACVFPGIGQPAVTAVDVCIVRVNPEVIDSRYLVHFLNSTDALRQVSSKASGSTRQRISRSNLGTISIPLPPLDEQRRIAAILDRASTLKAAQERRAKLLEKMEASLLNEMESVLAVGSRKFILNDLTSKDDKINYGVVQPGGQFEGGIPLIRAGDLKRGRVDRTSLKYIDPEIEKAYKRSRVTGNEILINCVGSVGAVALAGPEDIGANVARAVARVPVSQSVDRKWLAAYLRSATVQRYFQNELRTVSQPTLNIKQIKETVIDLPPESSQKEFSHQLTAAEEVTSKFSFSELEMNALVESIQASIFQVTF